MPQRWPAIFAACVLGLFWAGAAPESAAQGRRVSAVDEGLYTWLGKYALVADKNIPSAEACRDRCLANAQCKAWQWGTQKNPDPQMRGTCLIGSGHESRQRRTGVQAEWILSGIVTEGPVPEVKPPIGKPPAAVKGSDKQDKPDKKEQARRSAILVGIVYDIAEGTHLIETKALPTAAACRDWCLSFDLCRAWTVRLPRDGKAGQCTIGTGFVDKGRAPPALAKFVASGRAAEAGAVAR